MYTQIPYKHTDVANTNNKNLNFRLPTPRHEADASDYSINLYEGHQCGD